MALGGSKHSVEPNERRPALEDTQFTASQVLQYSVGRGIGEHYKESVGPSSLDDMTSVALVMQFFSSNHVQDAVRDSGSCSAIQYQALLGSRMSQNIEQFHEDCEPKDDSCSFWSWASRDVA